MPTFYIVDDDPPVRKILRNIVEEEGLGQVVGEAGDGREAASRIPLLKPDVILIDLLLPGLDGIGLADGLKDLGSTATLVMLSQVTDKEMVGQAYQAGIRFFIHKPVNRVEILSVLRSVLETLSLRQTLDRVRRLIDQPPVEPAPPRTGPSLEQAMSQAFSRLGIVGESGTRDMAAILVLLHQAGTRQGRERLRHLQGLYNELRREESALQSSARTRVPFAAPGGKPPERNQLSDPGQVGTKADATRPSLEERAIEQRIRRTIGVALHNLAALGLEHPESEVFKRYATRYFEFAEVRNEMRFLKGESPYHGKTSIRRFLEALFLEVEGELRGE
ncbi:MAG: DNA-binding domain-containing protein [Firmicutes bacterium]|nr:DNA-binding domain-containing protein [Bacillota bacterium]